MNSTIDCSLWSFDFYKAVGRPGCALVPTSSTHIRLIPSKAMSNSAKQPEPAKSTGKDDAVRQSEPPKFRQCPAATADIEPGNVVYSKGIKIDPLDIMSTNKKTSMRYVQPLSYMYTYIWLPVLNMISRSITGAIPHHGIVIKQESGAIFVTPLNTFGKTTSLVKAITEKKLDAKTILPYRIPVKPAVREDGMRWDQQEEHDRDVEFYSWITVRGLIKLEGTKVSAPNELVPPLS